MKIYYYDLETYPNCFLFCGMFEDSDEIQMFEISDRINEKDKLLSWLSYLKSIGAHLEGFNNLHFDYPILHELLMNPYTFDAAKAYQLAQNIFAQEYGKSQQAVRLNDRLLPQIDLSKLNHFDNQAKRTRLKDLQFAMRSESVEDLPFEVRPLTFAEMDQLRTYNIHDVTETKKFGLICKEHVLRRQELIETGVLGGDVLNYSDVKIGVEYLIKKIGRAKCFISGSNPRQTFRTEIRIQDVILPKIYFRTTAYEEVLEWFKKQTIYPTKENKLSLETNLSGLPFKFGIGGVHASVKSRHYQSNRTHVIKDIDVSGMYVAVAIANGFYPEHLGQEFVTAYRQLQTDRKRYDKKSTMNLILKLAGNGVYGNSNMIYSCFYDPRYTFSVTVNGQLQLIQLAEVLSLIPGLELIQANTDGITCYMPRDMEPLFQFWKSDWEKETGLRLEEVEYDRMWIRDVNSYIAIDTKGEVKRKGAYRFPETLKDYWGGSGSEWHKDFSQMVVPKAAEQVLRTGCTPLEAVLCCTDPFDFMLRYKATGQSKVFIGNKLMQKTTRYYVSTAGEKMRKEAPPKGELGAYKRKQKLDDDFYLKVLSEIPKGAWDARIHTKNKSVYEENVTSIQSGRLVRECNKLSNFDWTNVDFAYYADEVRKLIVGEETNED